NNALRHEIKTLVVRVLAAHNQLSIASDIEAVSQDVHLSAEAGKINPQGRFDIRVFAISAARINDREEAHPAAVGAAENGNGGTVGVDGVKAQIALLVAADEVYRIHQEYI